MSSHEPRYTPQPKHVTALTKATSTKYESISTPQRVLILLYMYYIYIYVKSVTLSLSVCVLILLHWSPSASLILQHVSSYDYVFVTLRLSPAENTTICLLILLQVSTFSCLHFHVSSYQNIFVLRLDDVVYVIP